MLEKGIPFVGRSEVKVLELEPGYVKMLMPLEPNINHVGTMYAGNDADKDTRKACGSNRPASRCTT